MKQLNIEVVTYQEQYQEIQNIRERAFQEQQGIIPELQDDHLDSTSMHLLAYLDIKPVGTVRIKDIQTHTAKIEKLAILPELETHNIALTIIQTALEIIKINDFETVLVLDRANRLTFYQELGFGQSGNTFQKLGIAYIKMVKQLKRLEDIDRQEAN